MPIIIPAGGGGGGGGGSDTGGGGGGTSYSGASGGDVIIAVTDANGTTTTFDSHAPDPADRPRGIQWGTQIQSGFYTAGFNLRRPIDRDNDDIHLGDNVEFLLPGGDIVYEGYVTALPRSMDANTHTLSVSCAGWMAHASDEPFTEIFLDRDLSAWGEVSVARRVASIAGGLQPDGGTLTVAPDAAGTPALVSSRPGVLENPINEFVYDAGDGPMVGALFVGTQTLFGLSTADTDVEVYALFWSDDNGADQIISTNKRTAATFTEDTLLTPRRYAVMDWRRAGSGFGTAGVDYGVRWQNVAVYGAHGLTVRNGFPGGFYASDIIRYLAGRYCPLLDTSGVQSTSYPISHLVFRDDTRPYDAFLKVNSYHLWQLAVWENKRLVFSPIDLTDWDWEIRHDEVGNQIGLQGDDLTTLRNGIIVQFTNVATGATQRLHPDDHPELRDDSIDNPYTMHGRRAYGAPFIVPFPTTAADALELGRLQLQEDNQPKAPGSFTVQHQIRDRSGVYQPVAKVRAGDRIRLTSSVNLSDRPRLVQETSMSQDGRTMTIGVDSTLRFLEGYVDRVSTSLAAANLAA